MLLPLLEAVAAPAIPGHLLGLPLDPGAVLPDLAIDVADVGLVGFLRQSTDRHRQCPRRHHSRKSKAMMLCYVGDKEDGTAIHGDTTMVTTMTLTTTTTKTKYHDNDHDSAGDDVAWMLTRRTQPTLALLVDRGGHPRAKKELRCAWVPRALDAVGISVDLLRLEVQHQWDRPARCSRCCHCCLP